MWPTVAPHQQMTNYTIVGGFNSRNDLWFQKKSLNDSGQCCLTPVLDFQQSFKAITCNTI